MLASWALAKVGLPTTGSGAGDNVLQGLSATASFTRSATSA